jgi:hypothetical protein
MYSTIDLQKLVQMLSYLGIIGPGSYPAHSVVLGAGAHADPGAAGALLASNGPAADPSFQSLAALGIQPALAYTPAHSGANSDITSLSGLTGAISQNSGTLDLNNVWNAAAGHFRTQFIETGGVPRWVWGADGSSESGSNAGSNFFINRYSDAGTAIDTPVSINRASGSVAFSVGPTAPTASRGTNTAQLATTAFVVAHSQIPNIMDFGGDNTGASDNSAAFAAAVAAGPSGRACVYFPPGKYAFSSQLVYTLPTTAASVTIMGAGIDITELTWAGGGGFKVNYLGAFNSVHIRDMSITTGTTNTGSAISLIQTAASIPNPAESALSDITNVVMRGADGYDVSDYWAGGIDVSGVSNINFVNVQGIGSPAQAGFGMRIQGTASLPPVQFNITGSMFNSLQYGAIFGAYTQGITVNQSNFTANGTAGIHVPAGIVGTDQLTIINSQFASGIGINILSQYQNLMIANNLFIIQNIAGTYGIYNNAAVLFAYIGNTFQNANAPSLGNNPVGIYVNNTSGVAGVITGNVFRYMSPAIRLDTSASAVNVQSNAYFNNNTNISNSGTGNTLGGGSQ